MCRIILNGQRYATMNSRQKQPVEVKHLRGFKYFKRIDALLNHLHNSNNDPKRELHFDQYASLLLFYFFNGIITSMRGLQKVTDFDKVRKKLGISHASLGSLSEASHVFDSDGLREIFLSLSTEASAADGIPRPPGLDQRLALTAVDGSVLDALPRMVWALWLDETRRAAKLHLDFDILKGIPVGADITTASGVDSSETYHVKQTLEPNRLYVMDRGYAEYELLQSIMTAGSSFLCRLRQNTVYETVEERVVSEAARKAGVEYDRIVRLGSPMRRDAIRDTVRLVKIIVTNEESCSLGPRKSRVSSKHTYRTNSDVHEILLATDQLGLSSEDVGLMYRHRWQIELFFKWLKCVLGCRHWIAESKNGVELQVYAALIASLLIVLWTGKKPTKRTFEMIQFYLLGWVSEKEMDRHLSSLKPAV